MALPEHLANSPLIHAPPLSTLATVVQGDSSRIKDFHSRQDEIDETFSMGSFSGVRVK